MFEIPRGKVGVVIDGQFGSTGKGLIAAWIAQNSDFDFATTNASANAGHTAIIDGEKLVTYHLPMTSVLRKKPALLNAGSIIDPKVLLEEIDRLNFPEHLLFVDPRAAVITDKHIQTEKDAASGAAKIASTQHGVGQALCDKISRHPGTILARDVPELSQFIIGSTGSYMRHTLDNGGRGVVEVPQGLGLGINSGLEYPYVTSREISVSQALSDAGLHPKYLGPTMMTLRTLPIRVGNLVVNGEQIGWSGPFYADSAETTWGELGLVPEVTTVTGRVRRVAGFSWHQLHHAVEILQPTHVFLNFANYLARADAVHMGALVRDAVRRGTGINPYIFLGFGPDPKDILLQP